MAKAPDSSRGHSGSSQEQLANPDLPALSEDDRRLVSEGERAQKTLPSSSQSAKDVIQRTLQALTLAGLGLYGAIRFGQQLYCDSLGINPEEIGLTYTASISRAAVILISLSAPLALFVVVVLAYAVFEGTNRAARRMQEGILAISVIITIIVIFLANELLDLSLNPLVIFLTPIVLYFVTWLLVLLYFYAQGGDEGRPLLIIDRDLVAEADFSYQRVIGLGLLALVIIASFLMAGFFARSQADAVKAGRSVGQGEGLQILGLKANPVLITGAVPKELQIEKRRLLYLGRADGKLVVFDVACDKPLRLADPQLSIAVLDEFPTGTSTNCVSRPAE